MKRQNLTTQTDEELVYSFERLCIDQYDAMEGNENARANRLVWKVHAVEMELKGRSGDRRRLLKLLFGHPNMQVRLSAARATLAVDYIAARHELRSIADTKWYPQAAEASMALDSLDSGFYRPT